MQGTAITSDQKREFLEHIRAGDIRPTAAAKVGSTGSRFRALCNPESFVYDEQFAENYKEIMDSGEHGQNRLERLQAAADERALNESDRLLEKLLLIEDPKWEFMRTQKIDVNASLETFVHQHFGHLTSEQIRQIISWVESGQPEIEAPKLLEMPPEEEEAA